MGFFFLKFNLDLKLISFFFGLKRLFLIILETSTVFVLCFSCFVFDVNFDKIVRNLNSCEKK